MADPNIEPHPYDLAKMHNFYRCTNDVIRPLCYLKYFHTWKNLLGVSIPGAPVFFDPRCANAHKCLDIHCT